MDQLQLYYNSITGQKVSHYYNYWKHKRSSFLLQCVDVQCCQLNITIPLPDAVSVLTMVSVTTCGEVRVVCGQHSDCMSK